MNVLHPFFDPKSVYRLATRESLWADGGYQSVRRFFHDLAAAAACSRWDFEQEIPPQPPPEGYGYGADLDADIHWFLRRNRELLSSREEPAPRGAEIMAGVPVPLGARAEDMMPRPGLVVVQLDPLPERLELRPVRPPEAGDDVFSGAGQAPPETRFDRFAVNVPGLPAHRWCMVLLVVDELLAALAQNALKMPAPTNQTAAMAVLAQALDAKALSGENGGPEAARRAFFLSTTWALAPGLEGISGEDCHFRAEVELGRQCPGLPHCCWVLVCVGPEVKTAGNL